MGFIDHCIVPYDTIKPSPNRLQPSTNTNVSNLNGTAMMFGCIICMPSAIKMAVIAKSIAIKGK